MKETVSTPQQTAVAIAAAMCPLQTYIYVRVRLQQVSSKGSSTLRLMSWSTTQKVFKEAVRSVSVQIRRHITVVLCTERGLLIWLSNP